MSTMYEYMTTLERIHTVGPVHTVETRLLDQNDII